MSKASRHLYRRRALRDRPGGRHRGGRPSRERRRGLPDDPRVGRAARAVLHDGRVLRMSRCHRWDRQPPRLSYRDRGRHAGGDPKGGSGCGRRWPPGSGGMNKLRDVSSFSERYDIVVVGAGPAGLAAATTSSELGASTLVLDENAGPGGQIYRAVTSTPVSAREILGEDYWRGAKLATAFRASSSSYARGATVWSVGPTLDESGRSEALEIGVSLGGSTRLIQAREVILATGALERPFPIPGWTLPGVMTAGAAQIALKSSGLVPDGRVVIAGTGPLLYLLAAQLIEAGATIAAVLDTTPRENWLAALRHLPGFL